MTSHRGFLDASKSIQEPYKGRLHMAQVAASEQVTQTVYRDAKGAPDTGHLTMTGIVLGRQRACRLLVIKA